jgi:hypothetical protein
MKGISSSIHSAESCGTSQSHDQTVFATSRHERISPCRKPQRRWRSLVSQCRALTCHHVLYKLKRIHCLIRYSVSEFIERSWASRFACTFVESELELTVQKESCISRGQLTLDEIQLADFPCFSCRKTDFNWNSNISSCFTMSYISYSVRGICKNIAKV